MDNAKLPSTSVEWTELYASTNTAVLSDQVWEHAFNKNRKEIGLSFDIKVSEFQM